MGTRPLRLIAVAPLLALAATTTPVHADSTSAFEAANLTGTCAAVEMTVVSGYQFVVKPDVQVPRATSVVEEGTSEAISSPADPGDSVDGLPALGIPEAEGYLDNGYPGAPSPFAGQGLSTLPHPFDSVGSTLVSNPFNTTLTYPYEHADAGYPNPESPGDQTATLGNLPSPTFTDPSGIIGVDGASGTSKAGNGYAVADAGIGASTAVATPASPAAVTSLPTVGISVGRVSAHSASEVLSDRVTQVSTCTLDDVEINVPGAPQINIGALVATATTQRLLAANGATGSENVEFSGVTVNGKGATIDQRGLTINGHTVPLSPSGSVTPPTSVPCLSGTPCVGTPTLALAGTTVARKQRSSNEYAVGATGTTLTLTMSAPVPGSITPSCPKPPNCGSPVSNTPVVYDIMLGNVASEAYGLPAQSLSSTSGLGGLVGGFAGIVGGSLGNVTPATGPHTTTSGGHGGQPSTLASILVTPGERALVLGLASILELLLLAGVGRNWWRGRRHVLAPMETTDLP